MEVFDFRINQPVYVQALESYSRLEALLETEKEKQAENNIKMEQLWKGESAGIYGKDANAFLCNGRYDHAYTQVKGLRELLEDTLPEVNDLLVRCEGFTDQLKSDSYVAPVSPAKGDNTSRNGGILSLNYDMIGVIKDLCDQIEEEGRTLAVTIKSAMESCASLVEGVGEELTALATAAKILNRVANYKDSFQIYETRIRRLEFDMNLQLCALSENVKEVCQAAGISETELSSEVMDLEDVYNPLYMSQQDLETLMRLYLERNDVGGMQRVAGQIFSQDIEAWNDGETMFIAETLNYAFKNENLEMIEGYIGRMFTGEYTEPKLEYRDINSYRSSYSSEYQAKPDIAMLERIMGQMNPEGQGTVYYTLNRLKGLSMGKVKVNHKDRELLKCVSCLVDASKVDGKIKLTFHSQVPKEYRNVCNCTDLKYAITACDIRTIITKKDGEKLGEIGFTPEQVEEMRLSVVSDTDLQFLDKLADRDYGHAFDISDVYISNNTGKFLADYVMILEANQEKQELEDMINGMLATSPSDNFINPDTRGGYMEILKKNLLEQIYKADLEILTLPLNSPEEKEVIRDAQRMYKQYGLWCAVESLYDLEAADQGFRFLEYYDLPYVNGYSHAVISELSDGISEQYSMYSFNFDLVGSEDGKSILEGWHGAIETSIVSDQNYANAILFADLLKLREQKEQLSVDTLVKGITMVTDKVLPGASYIIPIIEALEQGGFESLAEAQTGFPYEKYMKSYTPSEGAVLTRKEIDNVVNAYFKYQKLNRQIEEKQRTLYNMNVAQAIQIECRLYDEQGRYFVPDKDKEPSQGKALAGEGILLPQAVKNLSRWEEEGIVAYLHDCGISNTDEIIERLKIKYNDSEDLETMIDGGDFSNIPQDTFVSHMQKIDIYMKSINIGENSIGQWVREGGQFNEEE